MMVRIIPLVKGAMKNANIVKVIADRWCIYMTPEGTSAF